MTGLFAMINFIVLLVPVALVGVLLWLLVRAVQALESIAESLKKR